MGNVWDAQVYADSFSFVTAHGDVLLDLLAAGPGETVVDLGCGTGEHSARLADSGVHVVGVDASVDMLARAGALAPGVEFVHADVVRAEPAVTGFDAVVSNAALHWMVPQERALAYARGCLRPGGRFVAEMGGRGNVQALLAVFHEALRECGYPDADQVVNWFPSVSEEATLLEENGFEVRSMALFDRPTRLAEGTSPADWCQHFRADTWARVPGSTRPRLRSVIDELAAGSLLVDGHWTADYRRLRFVAVAV